MGGRKNNNVKKNMKLNTKVKNKFKTADRVHKLWLKSGLRNKRIPLRRRLKEQLKGSHFRYFNEQFYVSSSTEAKEYFAKHPDEFKAYHEGYEHQASLWPVNPVDEFIKELQRRPKSGNREIIADFGCGQAKIAQTLNKDRYKVFSFDLVAVNEHVTVSDMAHTTLFSNSVDIAVFCLSLMGSNISQFIKEANRVLKENGFMKISEIKSRFSNVDEFVRNVENFGFVLTKKYLSDPVFYYFDFKKKTKISKKRKKNLPDIILNPCLYKYR